ncbi:MAG: RICIN domain-containing protein [Bacteroidota bacterium]
MKKIIIKRFFATLIVLLAMASFHAKGQQINLPGFGEIPVTQNGDQYSVTFDDYGTFDFTGSLNPLELESEITIDQLKNFPGYNVFKNLDLREIIVNLSTDGFEMEAKAGTNGKLDRLTRILKIDDPFIIINSKIAKDGFAMEGTLNFEDDPIRINISPELGTRYAFESIKLASSFGIDMPGSDDDESDDGGNNSSNSASQKGSAFDVEPSIGVETQIRLRPTQWDPDLKLVNSFDYNLVTQEISSAGSMVDTWKNPAGMDNLFDKDIVSFTNTAVSMGYIPGSPTPTSIGFNLDEARFFHLTFGAAMTIAPADRSVAMRGHRNEMTMNDFTRIMRDGFGLHLPDVFPNDINIKDVSVLYSPNGGEIGEFKLEQGFALRGTAQLLEAATADIDFFANFDDGFYLDYNLGADLKKALMNELRKVKPLAPVMEKVLSTFQLRKVNTHLKAGMDLKMSGKTNVAFDVFGKNHKFDMQASLDPETIINAIIDKVKEQGQVIEIAGKVAGTVGDASNKAFGIANGAWNDASKFIGTATEHSHVDKAAESVFGTIKNAAKGKLEVSNKSKETCDKKCVPELANKMANPLLAGTNKAVRVFYSEVSPQLGRVVGENKEETKKLRKELVWDEWKKLADKIDRDWSKIRSDDTYISYYILPKSATNGGHIYRRIIDKKKNEHKKFRHDLWHKLMTEVDKSNEKYNVYRIYSVADNEKSWDIPGYHFKAKTKGGKLSMYKDDNGADRFIKVIDNDDGTVTFQPQHSDNIVDVTGGSNEPGVHMQLWHQNNTASQKFKLHKVPGQKAKTFFIETKDGLYLTAGRRVTQEKPTKSENQMWYFERAYTSEMDPPPSAKYRIRSMAGKKMYLDVPGSGKNIKGKGAKLQLWDLDHHPDRTIHIKERKANLYSFQPLHSNNVFDVSGGSNKNGARIGLWDSHGGTNQLFEFIYAGAPRVYNIRIAKSGKFIDAGASKINEKGCHVQQWSENGGENQKWKLESVGPQWAIPQKNQAFHIRPAYSKKYWDLGGDGPETNKKGKRFKLWSLDNGGDRKYVFKSTGDHSWLNIEVQNGGRHVDVKSAKVKSNGAPLHLWDAHGGDSQKFAMKPTSRNTFVLFSKGYKAVDVKGGNIDDNGSAIHLWSRHYGPSQQFVLEYADGSKKGQLFNFEGF